MVDLMDIDHQVDAELGGDTRPALSHQPDDDELATVVATEWQNRVAYLYGQWHVYTDGCWRVKAPQQMKMGLRQLLRQLRLRGTHIKINHTQVTNLSRMLESDLFMPDEDFDALMPAQEDYINLQNGMYNLNTYKLEKHDPELRFTTQLDFEYDPRAECPTWERYLKTSLVRADDKPDDELIMLLQEALAYSMTARTDLKASFWLVGKPDSGKSTLLAFIRGLMGNLSTTIDLNQLAGNRFILSGIVGKRVVTFGEAEENSVLPSALYKAMVGGTDEIYADVKNRPGIAFKPIAKFWWGMNNAPRMTDRSGATLNRLKVIPFNRSVPPDKRIGNLYQLLMRERSGIFNWLLYGYVRLLERGTFTTSEQSEAWRGNYSVENDTEQSFVNERCKRGGSDVRVQAQTLYNAYRRYCDDNGFRPKNANQVAKEWERLGFYRGASDGIRYWYGLSIPTIDLSNL